MLSSRIPSQHTVLHSKPWFHTVYLYQIFYAGQMSLLYHYDLINLLSKKHHTSVPSFCPQTQLQCTGPPAPQTQLNHLKRYNKFLMLQTNFLQGGLGFFKIKQFSQVHIFEHIVLFKYVRKTFKALFSCLNRSDGWTTAVSKWEQAKPEAV